MAEDEHSTDMRHGLGTTLSPHGFECTSNAQFDLESSEQHEREVFRDPSRSKDQTASIAILPRPDPTQPSPSKNMAKPNMRQAKGNPKIKCEYPNCTVTFGRTLDKQRHMKEKHGPLIYYCIAGYRWTRRIEILRAHLDNVHRHEANTNCIHPSEFRTTTSQSPAPFSNHFPNLYANESRNLALTPPPIYTGYTSRPQTHQSQVGDVAGCGAFDRQAPQPQYNSTSLPSVAFRTRYQAAQYGVRVYRPVRIRVRRPVLHSAAQTAPTSVPPTYQDSAMGSTPQFSSNEPNGSTGSPNVGRFELNTNADGKEQ